MITRNTIAAAIRKARDEEQYSEALNRRYARFYAVGNCDPNGIHAPRTRQEQNTAAIERAYSKVIPTYAWPGGYDMAYMPATAEGSIIGDILCFGCAREFIQSDHDARLHGECQDGYEGEDSTDHLYCDECGGIIVEAWQRDEDDEDTAD